MKKTAIRQWVPGLLLSALSFNLIADDNIQRIQQKLNQIVPNAPKADIQLSPIKDIYQVTLGTNVLYITADTNHLFNGNLIDLNTRENLTEDAKNHARLNALNAIDSTSMIEFKAKDKTEHTITVFTDIDCPFCKKFHNEVEELNKNGITVRYLAFPRSGPNTPSYHKMVSIWCADDKVKAMDDAKKGMDPENKSCKNPVNDHMAQAQYFAISGTPTLILDNGQIIPGYVSAKELIPALKAQ